MDNNCTHAKIKKAFVAFLLSNKIYSKFLTNLNTLWDTHSANRRLKIDFKNLSIDRWCDKQMSNRESFIDAMCKWSTTTEGHEFWSDMNDKWLKILFEIDEDY